MGREGQGSRDGLGAASGNREAHGAPGGQIDRSAGSGGSRSAGRLRAGRRSGRSPAPAPGHDAGGMNGPIERAAGAGRGLGHLVASLVAGIPRSGMRWEESADPIRAEPPTSAEPPPTQNDVRPFPPVGKGRKTAKRRRVGGRRHRFDLERRGPEGRRRRPCRPSPLFSCASSAGSSGAAVQRERAARDRVRARRDPPRLSAARSRTISVPSDTIRVPSGSIGQILCGPSASAVSTACPASHRIAIVRRSGMLCDG